MFFLLRMAFWLSVVLMLLPTGSSQPEQTNGVAAGDAISAASATVGDLRQFCSRQPDACTVGTHVASELGYKAQAGAKMLYQFLTDSLAPKSTGSIAGSRFGKALLDKPTSDKPAMDRAAFDRASQNTLTSTDLAPAWRGPAQRKDGRRAI